MKENFLKHFFVIGGGTIVSMIIGLITTPIITRLVVPADYGRLSIFTMYSSILLMILCIGLDQSLVRYYYKEDTITYKRYIIRQCATIPMILGVICAVLLFVLQKNGIFVIGERIEEIVLFGIYLILQIVNRFSILIIRLEHKSKQYTMVNIINKILYVVLAIVMLKLVENNDALILFFATVVSYGIATVFSIFVEKKLWFYGGEKCRCKEVDFKTLVQYGYPFILSMGISTVFQYLDKIFINYYCGFEEVGIYTSATSLISLFALVQSTFNTLWTPMAIEHFEKNPDDKKFYQNGNAVITVVMFSIGICLVAFKDIFALILGPEYREAAYILPFLMFNPIMYTISETTVGGIVFFEKSKMHIVVAGISCICNFIGNMILVPQLGGRGAAISTGISYISFFLLRTLISNRYYYIDFRLRRFAILTATVIAYATLNTFYSNIGLTIVGFVVGILMLLLLYRDTFRFILEQTLLKNRRFTKQGE